jgi:hypothetical protein
MLKIITLIFVFLQVFFILLKKVLFSRSGIEKLADGKQSEAVLRERHTNYRESKDQDFQNTSKVSDYI